jgi:hypothetical protein
VSHARVVSAATARRGRQTIENKTVKTKGYCLLDGKEETVEAEGELESEKDGTLKYRLTKKSTGELKDDDKKEHTGMLAVLTYGCKPVRKLLFPLASRLTRLCPLGLL